MIYLCAPASGVYGILCFKCLHHPFQVSTSSSASVVYIIICFSCLRHHLLQFSTSSASGVCGIALCSSWYEPADPSYAPDVKTAECVRQCKLGWFANPIFGSGDYPEELKRQVPKVVRKMQGFVRTCKDEGEEENPLPEFTEEDKALIKGTKTL